MNLDTAFTDIDLGSDAGKWKVVFFWPKDFTFVCPTEIVGFGKLAGDFADRDAVVYGVSIDSEFVHLNWRLNHADLSDLPIPMLADIKRELAHGARRAGQGRGRGAARDLRGRSRRRDPLRLGERPVVGRNPPEVLRVLDALQTDELCPCNWNKGEEVLRRPDRIALPHVAPGPDATIRDRRQRCTSSGTEVYDHVTRIAEDPRFPTTPRISG